MDTDLEPMHAVDVSLHQYLTPTAISMEIRELLLEDVLLYWSTLFD